MDCPAKTIESFRTPSRILLPKLLRSRDGWKRKAGERKRSLKAAQVKVRDLQISREHWKEQVEAARRECEQLREQLRESQQKCAEAQAEAARLHDEAKKK
jgi:chromosome segregation ATPase